MDQKLAHYEIKGQIAIVTMDHPTMNALDAATKEAIAEVFKELDDRRQEIRVVILHGAGEKAFAAGADIKTFLELTPDTARRRLFRSHQIYSIVENFQWPVIGAIHGFCLGGGLELALCCDIRYAEETAKFGFPEVNLSVFPGNGGIARSLYHLPLGKLKELVFTGEMISATEALALGLIEKIVPPGKSMEASISLAERMIEKGPLGVAAGKKVINRARDLSISQGLEMESELWANLTATEDMKEGARAFIEKRKPQYRGR
ncbi:MAG: 3-hydroxybutyryl-CoA dehydratase [Deltaproteobacteria bacterium]|nr:3-hydroxybutyryl-CoA dehydratase [Deltaproteobacteria bacterium]MBM4324832.1 3-hydroxybutyryl-CoA dehydratase [Deltaproteobacteria bacterium]